MLRRTGLCQDQPDSLRLRGSSSLVGTVAAGEPPEMRGLGALVGESLPCRRLCGGAGWFQPLCCGWCSWEASNGPSNVRLETGRYPQALADTAGSRKPTSTALSGTGRHWLAPASCVLFSSAELHLDSLAVVPRVEMDGPIARGLRLGHIVSDLVGPVVSVEVVGTESVHDPLNLFLGVENGAAASDVLHGRQVHRGAVGACPQRWAAS